MAFKVNASAKGRLARTLLVISGILPSIIKVNIDSSPNEALKITLDRLDTLKDIDSEAVNELKKFLEASVVFSQSVLSVSSTADQKAITERIFKYSENHAKNCKDLGKGIVREAEINASGNPVVKAVYRAARYAVNVVSFRTSKDLVNNYKMLGAAYDELIGSMSASEKEMALISDAAQEFESAASSAEYIAKELLTAVQERDAVLKSDAQRLTDLLREIKADPNRAAEEQAASVASYEANLAFEDSQDKLKNMAFLSSVMDGQSGHLKILNETYKQSLKELTELTNKSAAKSISDQASTAMSIAILSVQQKKMVMTSALVEMEKNKVDMYGQIKDVDVVVRENMIEAQKSLEMNIKDVVDFSSEQVRIATANKSIRENLAEVSVRTANQMKAVLEQNVGKLKNLNLGLDAGQPVSLDTESVSVVKARQMKKTATLPATPSIEESRPAP